MADTFPRFRAAVVHAASVFLNRDASIEKACRLIEQAAEQGADIVAFPETFVPGYPFWIWTHTPTRGAPLFYELFTNSVVAGSPATDRIAAAARRAGIHVALGVSERDGGTLYNTQLFFDRRGVLAGRHRKLQPTHVERTIWGRGDGSDLKVFDTDIGRIGGLICWEHTMDLARYALTSQGQQVHIAAWPGISALTHDPNSGFFNGVVETAARYHAWAAQTFVLNASSVIDDEVLARLDLVGQPEMIRTGGGWSAIVSPTGRMLAGPNLDQEAVLVADVDLGEIVYLKYACDSAGHYARPDILRLAANFGAHPVAAPFGELFAPATAGPSEPAPVTMGSAPSSADGAVHVLPTESR
ncbi:carbon-nitrogen hydrolase family protein [Pigmentiphaga sp. NML080357]|uniref:carbon-nitrogen hydrolase family protein n=1 Tax=Pigmentiphaga sp. NML080357 TaxID=2008675 RepID=UPI0013031C7D|nr:carbon-nitrogen hydrolase family protein [Pigmentiphaga sp. NML080357]